MADFISVFKAKATELDSDAILVSDLAKKDMKFIKLDDMIMLQGKDVQLFCIMDTVPAPTTKCKIVHRISGKGTRYSAVVLAK